MNLIKTFAISVLLLSVCYAQAFSLCGVVKDKQTSLPISGAKITSLKTGSVCTTDNEGKFILVSNKSTSILSDTLVVSEKKYWEEKVALTSSNTSELDIQLQAKKQRLVITTDVGGGDPDDLESLVHALVLSDEFDLEGIIYGHAWVKADLNLGRERIESCIDAYEQTYMNLKVHSKDYPTPEYLRTIVKQGQTEPRMSGTGEGKDSDGSNLIVDLVDQKDDPRPLWVAAWGGANTIGQAYWKVKNTRTPEEIQKFVNKVRVYDILGQDDAGSWIAKTFPDAFYIRNAHEGVYGWAPSKSWTAENIQSHGPLGEIYPSAKWAIEGDSPSFFHVSSRGLNDPDEIAQGGWGGRFGTEKKTSVKLFSWAEKNAEVNANDIKLRPYALFTNTSEGSAAISKWKESIYNDFATRMDWSITPKYEDANHHPLAVLNGDKTRNVLEIKAIAGTSLDLSAIGSSDPDGDELNYSWSFYNEPSSYDGEVKIQNNTAQSAKVEIPQDAVDKSIHVILEVYDNGEPNLYAYRRIIIHAKQSKTALIDAELPATGMPYSPFPKNVVVTEVKHFDNVCWKIAAAGGTWYFENGETEGKSGFSSAFDQAGNDWIGNDADRGYNKSSNRGGRHEYRGWPNFGNGNFNHPQRKSGSTSKWVDENGNDIEFNGLLEGDHLIMRTSNSKYELEYHFFPTHAAIKILKAEDKYAFLYEGPIGGEQEASYEKDYYVFKDVIHRKCVEGGLGYLNSEFGNKIPSPFFYLADSDPNDKQVFYAGVKNVGPDTAGDEGWRQGENMVIFSFGRDEDKRAYTGTDAVCVFGFLPKDRGHEGITKLITNKLSNPFTK